MKTEIIKLFLNGAEAIQDLLDVAYVITFYRDNMCIQGQYKPEVAKTYVDLAGLKIRPDSGFIEGRMNINGIPVSIIMTK